MTQLALGTADFVNGVAMRYGEVSQSVFPDYSIRSITNGTHAPTWATPSFSRPLRPPHPKLAHGSAFAPLRRRDSAGPDFLGPRAREAGTP